MGLSGCSNDDSLHSTASANSNAASNSVQITYSANLPVKVIMGTTSSLILSFTSSDGNPITDFNITDGLSNLDSGWSQLGGASGVFSCSTLTTDNNNPCHLNLVFTPNNNTLSTGTLALKYSYTNNSGQVETGVITIPYATTASKWVRQLGASGGYTTGNGVSTDNNGNIYVVGATHSGLNGQAQTGSEDSFISQYSSSSTLNWTRQLGTIGGDTSGNDVNADDNGNVYIVGETDSGLNGQTQNGTKDAFISQYSGNGALNWTRQLGTNGGYTHGNGINADDNGNVYIVGETDSGLDGQTQNGAQDAFISQYSSSGTLNWTRQLGANGGSTFGYRVSADSSGNVYVAGYTTVGLNGQSQNGSKDAFISQYSSSGTLNWTRQLGANGGVTYGFGVSTDSSGNVYVAGYTTVGLNGQSQNGSQDAFISQYSSRGTLNWTRQLGANGGVTYGYGVSTDSNGNVYMVGVTDIGLNEQSLSGNKDVFISQYSSSGTLNWTRQLGAAGGTTVSFGVSTSTHGNVYVAGETTVGLSGQTQNGSQDSFIIQYGI